MIVGIIAAVVVAKIVGKVGFVIIPFAVLFGWLSNLMAYAFGELCESVYNINETVKQNSQK